MAKKSFTGIGLKENSSSDIPEYKRTILDDIDFGNNLQLNSSGLKRQTFLLREDVLNQIKDYIYTKKTNGDFLYTQQNLIEEALESFFKEKTVIKRPDSYIEKRGRK